MNREQEIEDFFGCIIMKTSVPLIEEYLDARDRKDQKTLDYFHTFGGYNRQMILNLREHRKQVEFGFTDLSFNEYGWINRPEFLDIEKISFSADGNNIEIGRGLNGIWTYTIHTRFCKGGHGSGLSVFDTQFKDRSQCLITGLDSFIAYFVKTLQAGENDNLSSKCLNEMRLLIKEGREIKKEIQNPEPKQMELLF